MNRSSVTVAVVAVVLLVVMLTSGQDQTSTLNAAFAQNCSEYDSYDFALKKFQRKACPVGEKFDLNTKVRKK